jgi:hypothetical protein
MTVIFQYVHIYFYSVNNAVKAIYACLDHFLVITVVCTCHLMCKLLPSGYFTILHIRIHFQNFHELAALTLSG